MTRRISSPAFVGRRAELDRLDDAFDRASDGRPSIVLIAGEAGVGKSRLLAEFSARVEARGGRTLIGGCLDVGEGSLPYAPFVEALRTLARELPPEARLAAFGAATAELRSLVPDLPSVESPAAVPSDVVTGRQARLFDSIIDALGRLTADQPAVLALEDLHWADGSTRDLIRFLARNVRSERLLLVATYRSDELHRRHPVLSLLSELERFERVELLELQRFSRDEVGEQLTGILGESPTAEQLEALLDRSDGVPFYVEELVANEDREHATIPATLRNILQLRLASLSDPTMEIVGAAAVIGRRFRHERLAAVADLEESRLLDALREAIDARILAPVDDPAGPAYAFRHALLREAAYDDLLPTARVRLHARLADHLARLLESDGDGDVSIVADFAIHADRAYDQGRALDGSVRAMLALADSAAYAEALLHGQRAIELWSRVPGVDRQVGMDRAELLLRTSRIAANAGHPKRAVDLGQEAIRELEAIGDQDRMAGALEEVARYAWEATDFAAASQAAERAYALIDHAEASSLSASVLSILGFLRYSEGRVGESVRLLEQAMAAAGAVGDRRKWVFAAGSLAEALVILGRPGRAARLAEEAAAAILERGAEPAAIYGSAGSAFAIWTVGRFADSERFGRQGLEWANRYGLGERQGQYERMTIIEALVELGRYEEAEELARPILSGSQNTPGAMWVGQAIARALIAQGRFDEAGRQMDRVRSVEGLMVSDVWRFEMECDMAAAQGDFEGVESAVEQAIAITSDETRAAAWLGLATGVGAAADRAVAASARRRRGEVAHVVGRAHRWLGLLRDIVGAAEADGGAGPFWIAALATSEAEATRCDGKPDTDLWADASDQWAALSHPLYEGRAQLRHAEAVLASGGAREEAEALLQHAHATAVRIGAVPLRVHLEGVAGRARIAVGVAAAGVADGEPEPSEPLVVLTPRELEVLRLVAGGHTNREVGDRLFISEKTVSVHVSNAMAKLGALSRYEAAATAERLGLLA